MNSYAFVVYDIYEGHTRPMDGALAQIDITFVKENGLFRKSHIYTTPEQRKQLIKNLNILRNPLPIAQIEKWYQEIFIISIFKTIVSLHTS